MSLAELYEQKKLCQACVLRSACQQVVVGTGQYENPTLMVVGEAPGSDEDIQGEPFVGRAGQLLREALRETSILNRRNTLISNTLGCRPPKNKFPTDDSPSICVSKWLMNEINEAKPQRMLLLGGQALKYVAGLEGITACRGQWYNVMGVRTMATYHPSYVLRCDDDGRLNVRKDFEGDIAAVAEEVAELLAKATPE